MKSRDSSQEFTQTISAAVDSLKKRDAETARRLINTAVQLDFDAPEPHNLMGILLELRGDDSTARKHYRAAYALDPTYKPACRNLERLVTFEWGPQSRAFDYGDAPVESANDLSKGTGI